MEEYINFIRKVEDYALSVSDYDCDILRELERETNLRTAYPQMLTSAIQGKFLQMLSCIIQPTYILDLGTFTGYSSLCLAQGMKTNGKLITIDYNPEPQEIAEAYFNKSEFAKNIVLKTGQAHEIIPTLDYKFDIIYMDTAKEDYCKMFDIAFEKLADNGVLIADNVLWYYKVLDKTKLKERDTAEIFKFNEYIKNHEKASSFLLPLGDGLMIVRKK